MTKMKKLVSFSLAASLALSVGLTACGSKDAKSSQTTNAATTQVTYKPITLNLAFRGLETVIAPTAADLMRKKMKDRYNMDLAIEYIDANTYIEKIQVRIAAGQVPDVFYMSDKAKVGQAIEANILVPLTDIVKNDPDWKKVDPNAISAGIFNGEYYYLPEARNIPQSLYYRADWAKKLNLKTPANADELYKMLHAFAKKDPDGNGKDDTYGFSIQGDMFSGEPYWHLFLPSLPQGLATYVDPKDNTIKSSYYLVDDMKKALQWFNKAYTEGILDKQFMLDKLADTENKFVTGKMGVWVKQPHWIMSRDTSMKAKFPEAEIAVLPVIKGAYGPNYLINAGGKNDGYFLSKKFADPERGKKFLSYYSGPEGVLDRAYGEEGKSFAVENGKFKWLMEDAKKVFQPGTVATSVHDIKLKEPMPVLENAMAATKGFQYTIDLGGVIAKSTLAQQKSADIKKLALDKLIKIIIGEIPVSKYDDLLGELKKAGMEDILAEMNKVYKEKK